MIHIEQNIFVIMMVFIRAGALIYNIPFFGGQRIPQLVKLALALGVSFAVYPAVEPFTAYPGHALEVFLIAMKELSIGLLMGLAARLVFFIVEFSGHVISTEVGLSLSSSFDPVSGTQSTTIGTLLFYFATLIFFITNMHLQILEAFALSFRYVTIGPSLGITGVENFIRASSKIFVVGVQIAAPMVALNFIINLAFAVLGKAAPKINVFMISFSVRIFAGFSLLLMTIILIFQYLYREIIETPARMIHFLIY